LFFTRAVGRRSTSFGVAGCRAGLISTRPFQWFSLGGSGAAVLFGGCKGAATSCLRFYVAKVQSGEYRWILSFHSLFGSWKISKAFDLMHEGKGIFLLRLSTSNAATLKPGFDVMQRFFAKNWSPPTKKPYWRLGNVSAISGISSTLFILRYGVRRSICRAGDQANRYRCLLVVWLALHGRKYFHASKAWSFILR